MKIKFDPWIITSIIILILFSLLNIFGIKPELTRDFIRYIFFSVALMVIGNYLGARLFRINLKLLYIVFIVLFAVTLIFGSEIRGARRWLLFGTLSFQTAEFFKPIFLIILSEIIIKYKYNQILPSIISGVLILPFIIFIIFQPDLTNAIMYSVVFILIIFLSGLSLRYYLITILVSLMCMPIGWQFLKNYQKLRIIGFINPTEHSLSLNYNINQSIIAVGSGGIFGRGLGMGTQSRLNFLPEYHTDFAYASLIEQFGLIGGLIILILFFVIIYRLLVAIKQSPKNQFKRYYLSGTILFFLISIFFNIGMNLGILPVAGIALPFISYGGSITASTMLMLGLAMSL